MHFRAMDPRKVLAELLYLAQRYQRLDFNATDNIIDKQLFKTLIPDLIQLRKDFRIFYEVKANLRKNELASLAAAGITEIQPGIESLSSAVLRRMRKGTTALQNIRLLKWCATYGIKVHWNIIYGLPHDASSDYAEMASIARHCFHFDAPNLIALSVERFSPYHEDPAAHGIDIVGASAHYRYAYPLEDEQFNEVAYAFDHRLVNPADVAQGLAALRHAVADWQAGVERVGTGTLKLFRGPGFALIKDRRPGRVSSDFRLGALEAAIYEACDTGLSQASICTALKSSECPIPSAESVRDFLAALVDAGLVFCEDGRYLSLAIETTPRELANASAKDAPASRVISLDGIRVVVESV